MRESSTSANVVHTLASTTTPMRTGNSGESVKGTSGTACIQ
ncbi:hypothetical protein [Corallococcus interemptor]|nr:hypothetical protein [Corallococcus interemptor]